MAQPLPVDVFHEWLRQTRGARSASAHLSGASPWLISALKDTDHMAATNAPMTLEVSAAIAAFFHAGEGPRHVAITRVLTSTGYPDGYVRPPMGEQGPNKEERVLRAFDAARERPRSSRMLVDELLGLLRNAGLIGAPKERWSEDEKRLRRALARSGWYLDDDGVLHAGAGVEVDTGGREALDEQVRRLRSSTQDPGLLIGTAKEMLESVAKFVLEELGIGAPSSDSFDHLWHLARERLGVLPQRVDPDLPGASAIKEIHQSSWSIARNVNELRKLQGTGHGRTLPTGVSEDLALLVVREACSVAEYMLRLLDKEVGRR